MVAFIKHKREEESIWEGEWYMSKFEYKITFESDAEDIPDILGKITETITEELLDKIVNVVPTITILDKKMIFIED